MTMWGFFRRVKVSEDLRDWLFVLIANGYWVALRRLHTIAYSSKTSARMCISQRTWVVSRYGRCDSHQCPLHRPHTASVTLCRSRRGLVRPFLPSPDSHRSCMHSRSESQLPDNPVEQPSRRSSWQRSSRARGRRGTCLRPADSRHVSRGR